MIILLLTSMLSLYGSVTAAAIGPYTIHFSQFMDAAKYGVLYNSETIISVTLKECIEKCIATKQCRYINYHRTSKTCYFIGHDMVAADTPSTEKKAGYVFGRKSEWEWQGHDQCSGCEGQGVCTTADNQICEDSGCGPPQVFDHATFYGNMFTIGHKVLYECLFGYIPLGNPVSICLENGTWSLSHIKCVCPPEWFVIGDSCYWVTPSYTMEEGMRVCQTHFASLVTMETTDENEKIKEKLRSDFAHMGAIYTGYTDHANEGNFVVHGMGTSLSFKDWGSGEPDGRTTENCMVFRQYFDYKWADIPCSAVRPCICEKKAVL